MRTLVTWLRASALVAVLLLFLPSMVTAQTAAPCDSTAPLLTYAIKHPVTRVGAATIRNACPSFQAGLLQWVALNPAYAAAVQRLLHGDPIPVPPPAPIPDPAPVPPTQPSPPLLGALDTLPNKMPMGPLTASTIIVPRGSAGRSVPDLRQGGGSTVTGEGAVRILTNLAKMGNFDPIVFPGDTTGKSHLHQFFGNSRITSAFTSDSIRANCSSTNSGGAANCTTYWTPAMVDANGRVVPPVDWRTDGSTSGVTIYYKVGYMMNAALITPPPTGLKMIAGDKNWTDTKQNQARVWWTCADGPGPAYSSTIPDCTGRLQLIVIFPQCWDGVNLDSPDHKSHMSYPNYANTANGSKCPAAYPVVIPEITELFYWPVPKGVKSSTWHISSDLDMTKPGGLSAHADWMMGWDPATMTALVVKCLNQNRDSGTNGLCNGFYLNPPPF